MPDWRVERKNVINITVLYAILLKTQYVRPEPHYIFHARVFLLNKKIEKKTKEGVKYKGKLNRLVGFKMHIGTPNIISHFMFGYFVSFTTFALTS